MITKHEDLVKRIFETYGRLCPNAKIAVHVASLAYYHESRVIREGEYSARVVVVDPNDENKTLCVLASRSGNSPENALANFFYDFDGPIFKMLERSTTYKEHAEEVDALRKGI